MNIDALSTDELEMLEISMPHEGNCARRAADAAECTCNRSRVIAELNRRRTDTGEYVDR